MSSRTPGSPPSLTAASRPPLGHRLLWIGGSSDAELSLARRQAETLAAVFEAGSVATAVERPPEVFLERSPAVILLASLTPTDVALADVVRLRIRWPLAPIVSVASGLLDGRRRSGPFLPGVEDVPWHDLGGRLASWLADRSAGRAGTLGMPATARREERFFGGAIPPSSEPGRPVTVAVAARRAIDLEAVGDLVIAAGGRVVQTMHGRPDLGVAAEAVVWDIGLPDSADLVWLGMLTAHRPRLGVILLDSFPRAERVTAALAAGAAAVLSRPGSAEALSGVLRRFADSTGTGLGPLAHRP